MWAAGCIFAEALLKRPLFFSKTNANSLYEIMSVIIKRFLLLIVKEILKIINNFLILKIISFD